MASARDLTHLVAYGLLRLLSAVVASLPEPVARRLGEMAGDLWFRSGGRRRAMAVRHMSRAGAPDPASAARLLFRAYGRYWAEVLWLRPERVAEVTARVEVEGIEHVRKAKAEGRGMIYALPHVGNWEVAGPIARREGLELVAVAEALRNQRLVQWFAGVRSALGIEVVLADRRGGVMRRLRRMLESNGAVALVTDRDLSRKGIEVEFFGERTTLPAGPVSLAIGADAPLFPVASYFAEGPGHRVVVRPPIPIPASGTREERVAAGTQLLAAALEELIRQAPTQWHLLQPNWPSDRT